MPRIGLLGYGQASAQHLQLARLVAIVRFDGELRPGFLVVAQLVAATTARPSARRIMRHEEQHTASAMLLVSQQARVVQVDAKRQADRTSA